MVAEVSTLRSSRALFIGAAAALVVAFVLATPSFRSDDEMAIANPESRSCGSILLPVDTFDDCIDRRNQASLIVAGLSLLAVGLAVAGVARQRGLSRRAGRADDADAPPPSLGRTATIVAVVALAASAVALLGDAGSSHCGATLTHAFGDRANDEFGNVDAQCARSYQERWVVAAIAVAVAIAAIAVAVAARSSRWPPWVAGAAAGIIAMSVALLWLTAIGPLGLASRGGR